MDFLDRLKKLCESEALSIYAWALMSNHFHLLVRTGNIPLSKTMRRLLTGYVVNYNRRYKRYGHLFQNRYKSILCEEDPYLLELTRYIHLNPLRGGIVKDEKAKETYRLKVKISDLSSLSKEICAGEGIEEEDLRSGVRKKAVVKCFR